MTKNSIKASALARRIGCMCAAASALLVSAPAFSSNQGALGATSTGSVSITVSVANRAQITGLTDIAFTAVDPASNATSSQSDCVWSNTATKGYSITATGSGTSGAFTLANGALTVPYTVQWAATTGQSSGSALTSGTPLGSLTTTAANPTCSTGAATTSSLIVTISSANLQGMTAGASYTGTLTLLVTPQ